MFRPPNHRSQNLLAIAWRESASSCFAQAFLAQACRRSSQANDVRRSLGTLLAGERSIYWKLSGRENLEYFAALYHIPQPMAKKRVEELIERMEFKERANELVEKYSTGMRQRVAIAKALLARPPILLWMNPRSGWTLKLLAVQES